MKRIALLAIFVLFLLMAAIEADAATLSNIFKVFSKNSTTTKTTTTSSADAKTSVDTKSEGTKTEDKTAFEKEYPEKETFVTSKDKTDADVKTKSMAKAEDTKTSEKTKEVSKTQTRWKVTDDGKLKVDVKADSVCISSADQTLSVGETAPQQKQYEFRSGMVRCTGGSGFFEVRTEDDPVVEIVECNERELTAKCREGFVLNYGGSCSYGDDVNQQYRGIEKLYSIPSFFGNDWDTLPASNEIMIRCNTDVDVEARGFSEISTRLISVDKTLYITCVREKS